MAELLISGRSTRKEALRSLIARLEAAIPEVEPVEDHERVSMLTLSTSASAYETSEPGPDESEGPNLLGAGILQAADIVSLVLPAVAWVTVKGR
jgi:hypothetical protein